MTGERSDQPVRTKEQDDSQLDHDRAADEFEPTAGLFLQFSSAQRDHRDGHHEAVIEAVSQVIEAR